MAKKLYWEQESEGERHEVVLTYSYFSGKAVVEIDGMSFDISTKPFSLRGTNQAFRLGEEMAVLDFPKKGIPAVILGGERLTPVKK